jgi:hypothetical protein
MTRLLLVTCLWTIASCAHELPLEATDAGNPQAKTVAVDEGSGVLGADFNADSIAPGGAAASGGHEHHHGAAEAAPSAYTCMHHPEVISDKRGKCPKCGMDLVPKEPASAAPQPSAPPHQHEGH